MNIVLMLAHAVEEYDQVKLLTEIGYGVFSIGAYSDPAHPAVDIRPPLPQAGDYPQLREACHAKRAEHAEAGHKAVDSPDGPRDPVDWAKADLPEELLDWADVVICHHFEHTWIVPSWARLKASGKRIIWRTVGQSVEYNERMMAPLREDGLQVVRYSPKEQNIPGYCGADAMIRFYKDPDEWKGWDGGNPVVTNWTQNLRQRDPYTNWRFWNEATRGLPHVPGGPGSKEIGGLGEMDWTEMRESLRDSRAYLYTGTQPASYTLGLIEAMMTGIPVVSIGPEWMDVFPYGPELFEGHEIADRWTNNPGLARNMLKAMLNDKVLADLYSKIQRARAIGLFGKDKIAKEWKVFLGEP